jgi:acetyltransferase-like isoleucine patch superfamily enzyme
VSGRDRRARLRRALTGAGPAYWTYVRVIRRARRALFIARLQAQASLRGSSISVDIAPDVALGRHIRAEIVPGTSGNRLVIGPESRLQDDVSLWFRGGSIEIGRNTAIRRGAVLTSAGRLVVGDDVLVSWGCVLHCHESLVVEDFAVLSEHVTLVDSKHLRTALDVPLLHQVESAPSQIGKGVWIGAKALVVAGVHVGDGAVVAGGAVVTEDVEPWTLMAGNPARRIREIGPREAHPRS